MDITVSLPQTWVLLDGSQSSDDIKITTWKWEQLRWKHILMSWFYAHIKE
jgi:hypothetical protein